MLTFTLSRFSSSSAPVLAPVRIKSRYRKERSRHYGIQVDHAKHLVAISVKHHIVNFCIAMVRAFLQLALTVQAFLDAHRFGTFLDLLYQIFHLFQPACRISGYSSWNCRKRNSILWKSGMVSPSVPSVYRTTWSGNHRTLCQPHKKAQELLPHSFCCEG